MSLQASSPQCLGMAPSVGRATDSSSPNSLQSVILLAVKGGVSNSLEAPPKKNRPTFSVGGPRLSKKLNFTSQSSIFPPPSPQFKPPPSKEVRLLEVRPL